MLFNGVHPNFKTSWYIRIVKENLPLVEGMKKGPRPKKYYISKTRKRYNPLWGIFHERSIKEYIEAKRLKEHLKRRFISKRVSKRIQLRIIYMPLYLYKVKKWYRCVSRRYYVLGKRKSVVRKYKSSVVRKYTSSVVKYKKK